MQVRVEKVIARACVPVAMVGFVWLCAWFTCEFWVCCLRACARVCIC